MKPWHNMFTTTCFAELSEHTLTLECQGKDIQLPLARRSDGRLQPGCKESLVAEVSKFLHRSPLHPRVRLVCAVGARGLSLRRLSIPATGEEARHRLLQLQIESEFPLSPHELAWGSMSLNGAPARAGEIHQEQVLVAALRRQIVQEYVELFESCGARLVVVPSALARAVLCPQTSGRMGHLEIGAETSELLFVEDGNPTQLTVLPWGEKVATNLRPAGVPVAEHGALVSTEALNPGVLNISESKPAQNGRVAALAALLRNRPRPKILYLSGAEGVDDALARELGNELGTRCEVLQPDASSRNRSTAIAGLVTAARQNRELLRLNIEAEARSHRFGTGGPLPVKWAAAALSLLLLALVFPYCEALIFKPHLARKLADLKAERGRLRAIDSELEFLRYYKQMQPPYVDALYMISRAVPQGSRFDSISMTRRGELSLRGSVRDANQIADFRAKLLDSGLFSGVAIEEQTPSPDRQKLTVRMVAQWKGGQVTRDAAGLNAAKEPERPKSAYASFGPGMTPGGMGPPAMPFPGGPGDSLGPAGAPPLPRRGPTSSRTATLPSEGASQPPSGETRPPGGAMPTNSGIQQPPGGPSPGFENPPPPPPQP